MVSWVVVRFRPDLGLPDAVVPLSGHGPSVPAILAQLARALEERGATDPVAAFQVGTTEAYPARIEEVQSPVPVVETVWDKTRWL